MSTGHELALRRPPPPIPKRRRASEARLIRRAKAGSADAIEELIRLHWPTAHRAALLIVQDRHAAEDIAQEAVLAAARSLERFDRRRRFGPWLHRIVVNRSLDHLRSRQRRSEMELPSSEPDAMPPLTNDPRMSDVLAALSRLDPTDRAIIVLRHVLDQRSPEIAHMLGMPAATVRTRLRRGLTAIREDIAIGSPPS